MSTKAKLLMSFSTFTVGYIILSIAIGIIYENKCKRMETIALWGLFAGCCYLIFFFVFSRRRRRFTGLIVIGILLTTCITLMVVADGSVGLVWNSLKNWSFNDASANATFIFFYYGEAMLTWIQARPIHDEKVDEWRDKKWIESQWDVEIL